MDKATNMIGIFSMGLFFVWIMFFPFHGPGLSLLSVDSLHATIAFLVSHAIGLLHGAWLYYRGYFRGRSFARRLEKTFGWLILLMTILAAFTRISSPGWLIVILVGLGYVSGCIIIRWTYYLSSPEMSANRGAILGVTLLVSYSILHLLQLVALPQGTGGLQAGLLVSCVAAAVGGSLIAQLPVPRGGCRMTTLSDVIPPIPVLTFGVFAFGLSAMPFKVIMDVHVGFPAVSGIVVVPYVIGLLLGRMSDRYNRQYLATTSLVLLGLGFAVWTITPQIPWFLLLVQVLILSGNVCAILFYWLSLADHDSRSAAPFALAAGLTAKMMVFIAVFSATPHIDRSVLSSQSIIGAVGVILAFIGILVLFANYRYHKFPPSVFEQEAPTCGAVPANSPVLFAPIPMTELQLSELLKDDYKLTGREMDVAYLMLTGYTNAQIASTLCVTVSTAKFHVRNVLKKTETVNRHGFRQLVHGLTRLH